MGRARKETSAPELHEGRSSALRVLVVSADPTLCPRVATALRDLAHVVIGSPGAPSARREVQRRSFDVVVVDFGDRTSQGFEFLCECGYRLSAARIVAVARDETDSQTASRVGVHECLDARWSAEELRRAVQVDPGRSMAAQGVVREGRRPVDSANPVRPELSQLAPLRSRIAAVRAHPSHGVPRVVVLDEDSETQAFVRSALRGDAQILMHSVATLAIECLRTQAVDVFVLDLGPDGAYGLDLLHRLPSGDRPPRVVVFTGLRVTVAAANSLGVSAVLRKPCTVEQLRRAVFGPASPQQRG